MPIITVEIRQGRSPEQRQRFAKRVTEAAVEELDARLDRVRIRFDEFSPDDVALGGSLMSLEEK